MNESEVIRMYTCGPTIYGNVHLGNNRTFIWSDILRRCLELRGYAVKFAINFTDIDDKILNRTYAEGIDYFEFIANEQRYMFDLLRRLKVIRNGDTVPCTSNCIPEIALLISRLNTYRGMNSVLLKVDLNEYQAALDVDYAREIFRDTAKECSADFALWKYESNHPKWFYGGGSGRPAWHVECAAKMIFALNLNSETCLDYQVGGTDLVFPHHYNTTYILKTLGIRIQNNVNISHVLVDNQKMSKSLQNTMEASLASVEVLRFLCVSTNHTTPLRLSGGEGMEAILEVAGKQRRKVLNRLQKLPEMCDRTEYEHALSKFNLARIIGLICSGQVPAKVAEHFIQYLEI